MRILPSLLFMVSLLFAGQALAQSGETPPTLEGAKTVSAAEAKAAIDSGVQPLDVRRKASYVESRLPKAKSIGSARDPKTNEFDIGVFGPKKDGPLLIYGHGSDGWSAVAAVNSAVKAGYSNVLWLRGGFVEWTKSGLPVEQ